MTDILSNIATNAAKSANVSERDFVENGLLHCGECRTQKQCRVFFPSEGERAVFCLCRCQREKNEAEEKESQQRIEMEKIARLRTQGIQDRQIRDWTFANDDGCNLSMSDKFMRYCVKWKEMREKNIGLLLWGGFGTGKSFYSACVSNYLIDIGVPVLMTSFAKIINALSGFATEDKNGYLNSFDKYRLLVIDDLGAERQSEFAQEVVYSVIDTRYKSAQPLIVTTNLTLDEIKDTPNLTHRRIYDRILEMCVPIYFNGESRRRAVYQEKTNVVRGVFSTDEDE